MKRLLDMGKSDMHDQGVFGLFDDANAGFANTKGWNNNDFLANILS